MGRLVQRTSDYSLQLREKQKLQRIYGLQECQFRGIFERAERQTGVTGDTLLRLLECRLDNVVYRLGFGASRKEARQLINHGHMLINGRKLNVPGALVKAGDAVEVRQTQPGDSPDSVALCRQSMGEVFRNGLNWTRRVQRNGSRVADQGPDCTTGQRTDGRRIVLAIMTIGGVRRIQASRPCLERTAHMDNEGGVMIKAMKDFQIPMRVEVDKDTLSPTFGSFTTEAFERGFGTTIGNSLRRVLLSSLTGAAVTTVKIEGVLHEFSTIPGVTEDVTSIILNVKSLRLALQGISRRRFG